MHNNAVLEEKDAMSSQGENSETLHLRLTSSASAILIAAGAVSLTIPSAFAERSIFITTHRKELDADGEMVLPLPLKLQDWRAWLSFANPLLDEGPDALKTAGVGSGNLDDERHVSALKVAEFLRDDATQAAATHALASGLFGAAAPEAPPTEEQQARALKAFQAVSPRCALAILATAWQNWKGRRYHLRRFPSTVHLLQLLPRTFHPAIVRTCCMNDPSSLRIDIDTVPLGRVSVKPPHRPTASAKCCVHGNAAVAGGASAGAGCTCATPMFQLLAAAAPLAAGSLCAAWRRGKRVTSDASSTTKRSGHQDRRQRCCTACTAHPHAQPRPSKRKHLRMLASAEQLEVARGGVDGAESAWQLPGGFLTHLRLCCDDRDGKLDPEIEPPLAQPIRWCAALRQLQSLRELVFSHSSHPGAACVRDFTAALRHLPALRRLRIEFFQNTFIDPDWIELPCPCSLQLLHGLSGLSQLLTLELVNCFMIADENIDGGVQYRGRNLELALSKLSRLSLLTRLSFDAIVSSEAHVDVFADAIKRLPALQELRARVDVAVFSDAGDDDDYAAYCQGNYLLQQLVTGPGLHALQNLHFDAYTSSQCGSGVQGGDFEIRSFHGQMRTSNPELLLRLTSLRLGHFRVCPYQSEHLAALIADMPALQSLDVDRVIHEDADGGLRCLAGALQHLPALTHLKLPNSVDTLPGVLDVLDALVQPGAVGREKLKDLDMRCSSLLPSDRVHVSPERAQRLAGLLRQFRGLERLNIDDLLLGRGGLRVVAEALEGLPHLRSLSAFMTTHATVVDASVVAPLTTGLTHLAMLCCS